MARRYFWEAIDRSSALFTVIPTLIGVGNAAFSVLFRAGHSGPHTAAVTTTLALLLTGALLLCVGVQSRLDSYQAFARDRGRRATDYMQIGTLLLLLALAAGGILAWGTL